MKKKKASPIFPSTYFGSDITAFPLLDREYTNGFTNWINQSLASSNQFSQASMYQAFKMVGHRPGILRQLAGNIALNGKAKHLAELCAKVL